MSIVTTTRAPGRGATRLRWLPNALTVARLAALPVLLGMLITAEGPTAPAAAILFGVIGATDMLDGHLARRLNAVTRFGRIADPFADRLLVAVGLIGIIALDRLSWVAPAILLLRDAVLIGGFLVLGRMGVDMRVDLAGKASSALTMVATGGAILIDALWVDVLMWTAVVLAVITFIHYVRIASRAVGARAASISP